MQVHVINDPEDCNYPFTPELYADPLVVYHGTTSCYHGSIALDGLQGRNTPFSLDDFRQLLQSHKRLMYGSWSSTVIKGLSSDLKIDQHEPRGVYLSANFWYARDYACNIGGETVHHALLATADFAEFLLDTERRAKHLHSLRKARAAYAENYVLDGPIQDLENESLLEQLYGQTMSIRQRLLTLTDQAYPCVYAVRVERSWFSSWKDAVELHGWVIKEANL